MEHRCGRENRAQRLGSEAVSEWEPDVATRRRECRMAATLRVSWADEPRRSSSSVIGGGNGEPSNGLDAFPSRTSSGIVSIHRPAVEREPTVPGVE